MQLLCIFKYKLVWLYIYNFKEVIFEEFYIYTFHPPQQSVWDQTRKSEVPQKQKQAVQINKYWARSLNLGQIKLSPLPSTMQQGLQIITRYNNEENNQ